MSCNNMLLKETADFDFRMPMEVSSDSGSSSTLGSSATGICRWLQSKLQAMKSRLTGLSDAIRNVSSYVSSRRNAATSVLRHHDDVVVFVDVKKSHRH
ncbi:hypothetical protein ACOMHN_038488 [Nucella lapillus]